MSDDVAKVEKTGIYVLPDKTPVRLKEGDVLPLGAEFRDEGAEREPSPRQAEKAAIAEAEEQRAKSAAPENRAKTKAPENR